MEELLQLHIVIPEQAIGTDSESSGSFDDVHELLSGEFPVPNKDTPSYDHLGTTVSSSLFERRPDNMRVISKFENTLNEWYPDASVFRSSYEQSFGEHRSVADPDTHIMFLVTNMNIQEPTIRWKLGKETLQMPSLVLDDEIFHTNDCGIFAIDSTSGDVLWEINYDRVTQVPVGNENQIIGNTGTELVSLDRATGEVQWRTEFDISEDQIIDSRVVLGTDSAYIGLRTGEVIALSLGTGNPRVLCECEDAVVDVQIIEQGLIVGTINGDLYLVDSSGKAEWPPESDVTPSIKHSQDGWLYGTANGSLLAIAEEDGSIKWEGDFPHADSIIQFDNILCVATMNGLIGVDAETGDRVWEFHAAGEAATTSNPVVASGVVACVSKNNLINGEVFTFDQNILHIFDPADGTELQRFELGVGECYGLSSLDDSVVCGVGGEFIHLENFPSPV